MHYKLTFLLLYFCIYTLNNMKTSHIPILFIHFIKHKQHDTMDVSHVEPTFCPNEFRNKS